MPVGIVGVSGFTPPRIVDNERIRSWSGADTEWIEARTGIRERRYADDGTPTSVLAARAAYPLVDGRVVQDGIGVIIVATSTPDQAQPATAVLLQRELGIREVPAFDVNAVCSGFLCALTVAEGLVTAGRDIFSALVVGADKYSAIMDRSDRRTVSLFGDGAGAVVLAAVPAGYGIHGSALFADGEAASFVEVKAGGTRKPLTHEGLDAGDHLFRMEGRAVRTWALHHVPRVVRRALDQAGIALHEIDRVVLHQGNTRMVEALADAMGIEEKKVALTAPQFGNTAAASIPLTLAVEHEQRPLQRGERILLAAVGGGMTAAAVVLTWY